MNERLLTLLGDIYYVQMWLNTPVPKFSGFSTEDMINFGYYTRMIEWFDGLSDQDILDIAREKI